jgi:hypothetical protein
MTSIAETAPIETPSTLPSAFDLILRGQHDLDELLEEESNHAPIIRKLLAVAVFGLAAQGFTVGLTAELLGAGTIPVVREAVAGPIALWMPIAFVIAFLGALSICLPSFYFYTQLSGLDASFRLVTAQALRTQATTSVFLFGVLPIYLALGLTSVVTDLLPPDTVLLLGLVSPFAVGLTGLFALHRGFRHMLTHLEITHYRRGNFLLRAVLAWSLVYTTVAPVALYRAVTWLAGIF